MIGLGVMCGSISFMISLLFSTHYQFSINTFLCYIISKFCCKIYNPDKQTFVIDYVPSSILNVNVNTTIDDEIHQIIIHNPEKRVINYNSRENY